MTGSALRRKLALAYLRRLPYNVFTRGSKMRDRVRPYRVVLALLCTIITMLPAACLAQTAQIVPALVGITQSNGILPCVGDGTTNCYGIPAGAVALQPEMFIQPDVAVMWYAVFQTGAWSGKLNVTFDLAENSVVVQSASATATAAANSTVLVTVSQSAPSNGYNGNATLEVGAVATPTGGGTPVTLKLGAIVQVGSTTTALLTALVGFSQRLDTQPTPPCFWVPPGSTGGTSCFAGMPYYSGAIWPGSVITPGAFGSLYVIFQTGNWKGEINGISYALTEGGATVLKGGIAGSVIKANTAFEGLATATIPNNGYTGPAVLTVAALATPAGGGSHITLKYSVPILVVAPPTE